MMKRRDALRLGLAGAGVGLAAGSARAQVETNQWDTFPQSGLVFPDTFEPSIVSHPSPPVAPFTAPLHVMKIAEPINPVTLDPPPEPERHQRFDEFAPQVFYREVISEFQWKYHWQEPYGDGTPNVVGRGGNPSIGSWSWGFNGQVPGETYHAYYGEPVFVRRENNLPDVGFANANFALPSITLHLHNAHTASESDGIPQDFFNPGEFWDHHYANFPAGFDDREIMSTLWYHDHRLDFTATNVYAGLSGFYLLFDERDSGNENDPNPNAFRLPSGEFDIPLILHDVQFDQNGQVVWDFFNPSPVPAGDHDVGNSQGTQNMYGPLPQAYTTNGMVGDKMTVNRIIQPYHEVLRRKYRLRLLNGGPSRLYKVYLQVVPEVGEPYFDDMVVLSTDGNLLERPQTHESLDLWIAQRHDIVVDFSKYVGGDRIRLVNQLEIRPDGAGPTGRIFDEVIPERDGLIEFRVQPGDVIDPSQIPDFMRAKPDIDLAEVRRERLFVFDYDNGLWTVNGRLMDPNRVDAAIEQGSAEIWTFRNAGNAWAHPVHTHFEEFQILEINGKRVTDDMVENGRKDVVSLGPNDEVKFFSRWRDFFGKHVMHCHNVVHEDHAMMIRWDIVEPGNGD